jgi:hypothetical protein
MTDIFFDSFFSSSSEIASSTFGSTVSLFEGVAPVGDAAAALVCGQACAESAEEVLVAGSDSTANRSTTAIFGRDPGSDECDWTLAGEDALLSCPPFWAEEFDATSSC